MSNLYSLILNEIEKASSHVKRKLFEVGPTGTSGPSGTTAPTTEPAELTAAGDDAAVAPSDQMGPGDGTSPSGDAPLVGGGADGQSAGNSPSPPPPEEPKDPKEELIDTAMALSKKTMDTPKILKTVKAGIQSKLNGDPGKSMEIAQDLKQSDDVTLKDVGKRLEQFVTIKEDKMKLAEQKLRAVIAKLVERKIQQLKESGELSNVLATLDKKPEPVVQGDPTFDVVRSLGIQIQQSALAFEKEIQKELDLVKPAEMDKASQDRYNEAAKQFHKNLVSAVTHMVKTIKDLPKNEKKEQ